MASPPNYNDALTENYLSKTLGSNTIPSDYPSLGQNTVPLPTNYPIQGYVPPRPPTTITNDNTFDNDRKIMLRISNPPLDVSSYIPVIKNNANVDITGVNVTGSITSGSITLQLPSNTPTGDYTPGIKKGATYISGSPATYTRPPTTISNPTVFTGEDIILRISNPPLDASAYIPVIKNNLGDLSGVTVVSGSIASGTITLSLPSNLPTGSYTPAIKKVSTYISGSSATYTRPEPTIRNPAVFNNNNGNILITINNPPVDVSGYIPVIKNNANIDISGVTVVSGSVISGSITLQLPYTALSGSYKPALKKGSTYILGTNATYNPPAPVRFYVTNLIATDGEGNLTNSTDFPNFTDNKLYRVFLDNYYMENSLYYINQNINYSNENSTSGGFLFILDNSGIPYYITNNIGTGTTFTICKRTDNMGSTSKPLSYYGLNLDPSKKVNLTLNASDVTTLEAFTQPAINGLKLTCLRNYRFYLTDWNAVTRYADLPKGYTIGGTDVLDISGGFDRPDNGIYNINFDNFAELDNPALATTDTTPDSSFYTEPTGITETNYTKFFVWENSPKSFFPYYLQKDNTGYFITKTLVKTAPANYPGNKDITKKIYFHIYKDGDAIDMKNLINSPYTTRKITFTHMRPNIGLITITSYNDPTPRSSPYIPPIDLYALDLYVQTLPNPLMAVNINIGEIDYYAKSTGANGRYNPIPTTDPNNKTSVTTYPMTTVNINGQSYEKGDLIPGNEGKGPPAFNRQSKIDQENYLEKKETKEYSDDRIKLTAADSAIGSLNKGTIAIANFEKSQVYYLHNANNLPKDTNIPSSDFASKLFVKHKTLNTYYKITPVSAISILPGLKNKYDFIWKISNTAGTQLIHCALSNDLNIKTPVIKVNSVIKTQAITPTTKLALLVMPTAGGGSNNKTRKNKSKRIIN